MADKYETYATTIVGPADEIFDITPNDSADLAWATRAINVAVSGTVRVTTVSNTTATLYVAAGIAFPIRAKRVFATGTAATGIVGLT